MRVLIVKVSSMGDVIHTLPAINDAVKSVPNIQFDWVVEKPFAEIPLWNPVISRVIPVNLRKWRKKLLVDYTREEFKQFMKTLRDVEYDLIIDAQGLLKSAMIAMFAKGPSVGYNRKSIREPAASFLYRRRIECDYQQHAIDRIRILFAKSLGYLVPELKQIDYGLIDRFQEKAALAKKKYFLFLHGTSAASKLWQVDNWIVLGRLLQQAGNEIILPWGSHEEYLRAQHIAKHLKPDQAEVLTKKNLTELKDYIFYAKGVVSVDTGLAHLAAALNKDNFVLYADTDPKLIGTLGMRQYHYLMKDISPKQLFESIMQHGDSRSYLRASQTDIEMA